LFAATCPPHRGAPQDNTFDVITVKNGSVSGFSIGVDLLHSTRGSVLGVTATNNLDGIRIGVQGLVKSSEASGSFTGIFLRGRGGQVQQCNLHDNGVGIDAVAAENCLITMNTANSNNVGIGLRFGSNKCTVSYNTASKNGRIGISLAEVVGALVTRNVALDNPEIDYQISCPSTVTYNDSTKGFPDSYDLNGTGCHTANNN
jgi:parallel beta-helix repeat protein